MLGEFDRLEVLIWETLIIDYHESDGELFEGPTRIYVTEIVESIEGTFGLSPERCLEIVGYFADVLEIPAHKRERLISYFHVHAEAELTTMLSEELARAIDQEILDNIRSIDTSVLEPIPEVNLHLEEIQVETRIRPRRRNETRDTGDG